MGRGGLLERYSNIYVAGGDTLIGAALLRQLRRQGYACVLGDGVETPDPSSAEGIERFFRRHRIEYVFHAAGQSGGIFANQNYPADLCFDNLSATLNFVGAAHRHGVHRLLYLASSCCYPKSCPQPMQESDLGGGEMEPSSHAYSSAKLAGVALCGAFRQQYGDDFIVGIPANAFGLEDDFDPQQAHVISALLARLHQAKTQGRPSVTIWGSGAARREFLFADDLADACLFVMRHSETPPLLNLGGGTEVSIRELAEMLREVVGYPGKLDFDPNRPDGAPRKSLDSTWLRAMGWRPATEFHDALAATYTAYLDHLHGNHFPRMAHAG